MEKWYEFDSCDEPKIWQDWRYEDEHGIAMKDGHPEDPCKAESSGGGHH